MKKKIVVLCSLLLSCQITVASEAVIQKKEIITMINEDTVKHKNENLLSKEELLSYFTEEEKKQLYATYIDTTEGISYGSVAKILCDFLGQGPVYLPVEEGCEDPFIGRLIISYIWGELPCSHKTFVTQKDWITLWQHTEQFRQDPDYIDKSLEVDKSNKNLKWRDTINNYEKVNLGSLENSIQKLSLGNQSYDIYQFLGTHYVRLNTLKSMGFEEQEKEGSIYLSFERDIKEPSAVAPLSEEEVYLSNHSIYIGEFKVQSLETKEETFIAVRALQPYFDLVIGEGEVTLVPKEYVLSQYLLVDEVSIENITDQAIEITYSNFYWKDSRIVEEEYEATQIPPKGKIIKPVDLYHLRGGRYLTTVIKSLENDSFKIECRDNLGQDIGEILTHYEKIISKKDEKPLVQEKPKDVSHDKTIFPDSLIMGTMKYKVASFEKGEKVEVWAAEQGNYYWVKDKSGEKVKVPWPSLMIPQNPESAKDTPTKKQIEAFINSKNMSSRTGYLVWTDLYRQHTYVFKGEKNAWEHIRTMACSTGNNVTPTPRGEFELQNRVAYFGTDKGYRCKNAFQIFGDYLYHSVLFDVTGTRLLGGTGKLGHRASHGCIRLSPEDSLWFYNTMQTNTKVWIN